MHAHAHTFTSQSHLSGVHYTRCYLNESEREATGQRDLTLKSAKGILSIVCKEEFLVAPTLKSNWLF